MIRAMIVAGVADLARFVLAGINQAQNAKTSIVQYFNKT